MNLAFYKAAAVHMKDPLSAQAPRPEVSGLVVPRRPAPRILPQSMGRGKGTVPTNPFSGNWQKAAEEEPAETRPWSHAAHAAGVGALGRASGLPALGSLATVAASRKGHGLLNTLGGIAGSRVFPHLALGALVRVAPHAPPGVVLPLATQMVEHPYAIDQALRVVGGAAGTYAADRLQSAASRKEAAAPGVPERIGKAVGGFIGKRPVAAAALAYGAYRSPDIVRALKERHDASRSPVGYGTVHALRGLATVGG